MSAIIVGVQKDTVKEVRVTIMDILKCSTADQETKREALVALANITQVNGTSITNCNFKLGE